MSTTIYNGRCFRGPFWAFAKFLLDNKEVFDEIYQQKQNSFYAKFVSKLIDESRHEQLPIILKPMQSAYKAYNSLIADEKNDPSVVFFESGDTTYFLLYADSEYNIVFDDCPLVEDFSYWDNTDWPEEMSEDEWALRGERWDNILGKRGLPLDHGFTFNLTNRMFTSPPTIEEVFSAIPDLEIRIMEMAKTQAITSYRRANQCNIVIAIDEVNKNQNLIEAEAEKLRKIITEISIEDMI